MLFLCHGNACRSPFAAALFRRDARERLATPVIDTRALAREQLELAAPIRVVCSENCLGLCPSCGKDLNAGPCGCDAEPVDPRWEALKDFKKS